MQCTMPPSYIIDPAVDFHDGIEQWFQYTREHAGLDNMYLFDEYQIHAETESASLTLDYQNSQLLLHEDMADIYRLSNHSRYFRSQIPKSAICQPFVLPRTAFHHFRLCSS